MMWVPPSPPRVWGAVGNRQVPERVLGGERLKLGEKLKLRVEKFKLKGEKLN